MSEALVPMMNNEYIDTTLHENVGAFLFRWASPDVHWPLSRPYRSHSFPFPPASHTISHHPGKAMPVLSSADEPTVRDVH